MSDKKVQDAANSDVSRATRGRPFTKGVSGNPSGRPPVPDDVKQAFKDMTMPAVQKLQEIISTSNNAKLVERACEYVINKSIGSLPIYNDLTVDKLDAEIKLLNEKVKLLQGATPDTSLMQALLEAIATEKD